MVFFLVISLAINEKHSASYKIDYQIEEDALAIKEHLSLLVNSLFITWFGSKS